MPSYLFVGGVKDGQWIEVPPHVYYYQIPYLNPQNFLLEDPQDLLHTPFLTESYELRSLTTQGKEVQVMAKSNYTTLDTLERLILGYRGIKGDGHGLDRN